MRKTKQEIALETFNRLEDYKCQMRQRYGCAWQTRMNDEDKELYEGIYSLVKWEDL